MVLFEKCPVCGMFAFIQPEQGNDVYRVFKCDNSHVFKKKIQQKILNEDKEILDHLPEWTRILNDIKKKHKFGG